LGAVWFAIFAAWAARHEIDRGEAQWPQWRYLHEFVVMYLVFAGLAGLVLLPGVFRAWGSVRPLYVGAAISALCVALSAPYGSLWGIVSVYDTILSVPLGLLWFAAPIPAIGSIVFYWIRCAMGPSQ
jgi:hypothetical protein